LRQRQLCLRPPAPQQQQQQQQQRRRLQSSRLRLKRYRPGSLNKMCEIRLGTGGYLWVSHGPLYIHATVAFLSLVLCRLDLLCSPDVLTAELTALDQTLAQNPADLDAVMRKAQVALKQQVLFGRVESGDLTLALLKDNMVHWWERDKHLARVLLKRGNKPFAGRVLQRSKMLQAEIEAAEQMIQQLAEAEASEAAP